MPSSAGDFGGAKAPKQCTAYSRRSGEQCKGPAIADSPNQKCYNCGQANDRYSTHTSCTRCAGLKSVSMRSLRDTRRTTGLCPKCGGTPVPGLAKCTKCIGRAKIRYNELKLAAIKAYGGCCQCPGCATYRFDDVSFLCIDHIGGGGNFHRKQLNCKTIYKWLYSNGYPVGFQVLCASCNQSKQINGGVCAHIKRPS